LQQQEDGIQTPWRQAMSRTITLRLDEQLHSKFSQFAQHDNRTLANFIETAVLRYIEGQELADDFEMTELRGDDELNQSIRQGLADAQAKRGRFV
jgi:predicted transcriptional regulator